MSREAFIKRFSTDTEFAKKALQVSSIEEARTLAKNEGYEFDDEQINQFLAGVEKLKTGQGGELNEEALELAVGGFDPEGTNDAGTDDCSWCPEYCYDKHRFRP